MSPARTLYTWAINWALGVVVCFAVLYLNAYLEHKHSETETASLTALVSDDRAAEFAATRGPK